MHADKQTFVSTPYRRNAAIGLLLCKQVDTGNLQVQLQATWFANRQRSRPAFGPGPVRISIEVPGKLSEIYPS